MAPSHEVVQLNVAQWLKVGGILLAALGRSLCLTATWCVQEKWASWQYGHFTQKQIRAASEPTGLQINHYCRQQRLPLTSVNFASDVAGVPDATLHFINCTPNEDTPVVLHCHGGGYVNPIMQNGHIPYAIHCASLAQGFEGRIALLEYTLAPGLKYPGQLAQVSAALRLLLEHRRPEQIIVAGDSAGGNLVMALLAHMIQPHPLIPPILLPKGSKLQAALLLSPWVAFDETSAASFRENETIDYITLGGMGGFKGLWQPNPDHVWAQPLKGGPSFWAQRNLPVDKVLLVAGEWEVLRDQVVAMGSAMGALPAGSDPKARVEVAVAPKEVHVQCILDEMLGLHDSNMARSVNKWLLSI
jgi:acetyl esterase/lipase